MLIGSSIYFFQLEVLEKVKGVNKEATKKNLQYIDHIYIVIYILKYIVHINVVLYLVT